MVKLSTLNWVPFLVLGFLLFPTIFTLDLPQFGPILERCFSSSSSVHRHYSGLNETELECCLLEDIAACHHRDCFTATTAAAASATPTSVSALKSQEALHMECNSTALQLTRQLINNACSKTDIPKAEVADYCTKRWISVKLTQSVEEYRCRLTIWGLVSVIFLQATVFIFWRQLADVGRGVKNRCRNYVFFL